MNLLILIVVISVAICAILGEDVEMPIFLINDVTSGVECTVSAIGNVLDRRVPECVKYGERIRVDRAQYSVAGYFISCGVGVASSGDLERSNMEGVFKFEIREPIATEHYISNHLTSVSRVVKSEITEDRLLAILNS